MNYKVVKTSDDGYDIFTEDGGVASICRVDDHYVTTYYQSRLTQWDNFQTMWESLAEGKTYVKDWKDYQLFDPTEEELIEDALSWLVMPMCEMNEIHASSPLCHELSWLVW